MLIPELRATGIELEETVYPGQQHCFGFYGGRSFGGVDSGSVSYGGEEAASAFFTDMHTFFKRYLQTQPRPLADSLV